ncbi:hypothetical protein EMGBS15_09800 [Filimonas sp.]|nr:hypothetical protein EMGBS15_09800 [Filimonas sp.]
MKKLSLLLLGAAAFLGAQSQSVTSPIQKIGKASAKVIEDNVYTGASAASGNKNKKTRDAFNPSTVGSKEWTGKSTYDLQTNGSMQRRVLQGAGGTTISCGWTFSAEQNVTATSAFADRGTGYAHFNGTSWTPAPTSAIENPFVRTGFGGLVVDGTGKENYIAHDPAANKLSISKKTGTTWASSVLSTSNTSAAIWPHTATSGNWMYLIASPSDSNIHTNGIRNGYFFARSNDNGNTWIDNMIPMPLVDSVGHYRGGGNSYAISARGNNVAILFGDMGTDLTLLKSTDNGATWTKSLVWDFPIDNYNFAGSTPTDIGNDGSVDTIFANDGSFSMVLDANGDVHAAFPILRVIKDGTSTGYSYFALTSRLVYFRQTATSDTTILVDDIFDSWHDCDKLNSVNFGANYTGATGVPDAAYNSIGLITQPSISIVPGSPQKVLIAYTCVMDNDTTIDDGVHPYWFGSSSLEGQPFRDVLVAGSSDNGDNWTFPVNVSQTGHFEEAFISTPEIITGSKLPILYQGDIEPGTILQNDDLYDPEFQNFMILQQVNVADIFTMGADTMSICNQTEVPLGTRDVVNGVLGLVNVYPNPSADIVNLSMKFVNTAKTVTVEMVDIAGKVVYSSQLQNVLESNTKIPVSQLSNGLYLIKLTTDAGTISRKFVKE